MNPWFWTILILLLGALAVLYFFQNRTNNQLVQRRLRLENMHNRALNAFETSIEKFAALVSGMQSYVNFSANMPGAEEFQNFIDHQLTYINYSDSIVVSFVDTSHTFQYSFTRNVMDPAGLKGKSVKNLRTPEELNRLNRLMQADSLRMSEPINLIEGWVGIPINFRVNRQDTVIGYIAPIINFKSIIQPIYELEASTDFVFRFRSGDGHDLSRERLYDGSRVYNSLKDPEFYRNYSVKPEEFLSSTLSFYGAHFIVGTAYKTPYRPDYRFLLTLFLSYLVFATFVLIISWQYTRTRKLHRRTIETNQQLAQRQLEISHKNEQLTRLNNTKNRFFSIIGHDVRGPLNSIEGLMRVLEHENIPDPALQKLVGKLSDSARTTTNLLDNLLRWARSQTGDMTFNPQNLNLKSLLSDVAEILLPQAQAKNISLTDELPKELCLHADRNMLLTVLRNLISNAIKFSPRGSQVTLSAEQDGKYLKLLVSDKGKGMTPEEMATLFNLDKRRSTAGTEGESGTGLGLLLCQEFVKRHGGHISVSSQPGKGSTFTVHLPLQHD